jgi:hypothetical protein
LVWVVVVEVVGRKTHNQELMELVVVVAVVDIPLESIRDLQDQRILNQVLVEMVL